jgi:hypothetical protein
MIALKEGREEPVLTGRALAVLRPARSDRRGRTGASRAKLSPHGIHVAVLAADLKAVWSAPPTDARLKKRIVRTIHEVVADIDDEASEIVVLIGLILDAYLQWSASRTRHLELGR